MLMRLKPVVLKRGFILAMVSAVFSLSACNGKANDAPPPKIAPAKLFQEERQALDKAKGVQQTLDQQQQKDRKQIEDQSK